MIEEVIRGWSGPVASLLAVTSMIYTWLTARSKTNEDKINGHERKLIEHDRRIQALEGDVKHLPTKDDFNELKVSLEAIKGDMGQIRESNAASGRAIRRVEEWLLNREKA